MSNGSEPFVIESPNNLTVTIPGFNPPMMQGGVVTIPGGGTPITIGGTNTVVSFPSSGGRPPIQISGASSGVSLSSGAGDPLQVTPAPTGPIVTFPSSGGRPPIQISGASGSVNLSFPSGSPPAELAGSQDGTVVLHSLASGHPKPVRTVVEAGSLVVEVPAGAGAVEWLADAAGALTMYFPSGTTVKTPPLPPN